MKRSTWSVFDVAYRQANTGTSGCHWQYVVTLLQTVEAKHYSMGLSFAFALFAVMPPDVDLVLTADEASEKGRSPHFPHSYWKRLQAAAYPAGLIEDSVVAQLARDARLQPPEKLCAKEWVMDGALLVPGRSLA